MFVDSDEDRILSQLRARERAKIIADLERQEAEETVYWNTHNCCSHHVSLSLSLALRCKSLGEEVWLREQKLNVKGIQNKEKKFKRLSIICRNTFTRPWLIWPSFYIHQSSVLHSPRRNEETNRGKSTSNPMNHHHVNIVSSDENIKRTFRNSNMVRK